MSHESQKPTDLESNEKSLLPKEIIDSLLQSSDKQLARSSSREEELDYLDKELDIKEKKNSQTLKKWLLGCVSTLLVLFSLSVLVFIYLLSFGIISVDSLVAIAFITTTFGFVWGVFRVIIGYYFNKPSK